MTKNKNFGQTCTMTQMSTSTSGFTSSAISGSGVASSDFA
jgi:hypothetical protein